MPDTIARILVPIDFSAHSDRALQDATTLASRFGARLELLHVVEDPFLSGAWSNEVYMPDITALMKGVTEDAESQLGELKESFAARPVRC